MGKKLLLIFTLFISVKALGQSCQNPAEFCGIDAGCVSTENLTVFGPAIFEGPVIFTFTGTTGGSCGGGVHCG